jgi:Fe-S-cluster containining protein
MRCGACCSFFEVSFDRQEITPEFESWQVPEYLAFADEEGTMTMFGTNIPHRPRCTALKGRVGKLATCQIYANRPGPCRKFQASYVDGTHNPRCDQARMAHGLEPLTPADWVQDPIAI